MILRFTQKLFFIFVIGIVALMLTTFDSMAKDKPPTPLEHLEYRGSQVTMGNYPDIAMFPNTTTNVSPEAPQITATGICRFRNYLFEEISGADIHGIAMVSSDGTVALDSNGIGPGVYAVDVRVRPETGSWDVCHDEQRIHITVNSDIPPTPTPLVVNVSCVEYPPDAVCRAEVSGGVPPYTYSPWSITGPIFYEEVDVSSPNLILMACDVNYPFDLIDANITVTDSVGTVVRGWDSFYCSAFDGQN